MFTSVRVLVIQKSAGEADEIVSAFRHGGLAPSYRHVTTREELRQALTTETWDLIVSDYAIAEFNSFFVLETVKALGLTIPVVIVAGPIGEERVAAIMEAGVAGFIIRGNWARLSSIIDRELKSSAARAERKKASDSRLTAHISMEREIQKRNQELHKLNELLREEVIERRRAEEAQLAISQRLNLTLRASKAGSWDWDFRTDSMIYSDEMRALFGMPPGDPLGTFNQRLQPVLPEDHDMVSTAVEQARKSGVLDVEFRIRRRDTGEIRWLCSRGQVSFDDAQKPIRMMGITFDITERKDLEQNLKAASQRLEAHLANSPLAIVEFDGRFTITRWSLEAERMFGWSAAEVVGKKIPDFKWVYEEDADRVTRLSADMISGAKPRNILSNRNYRKEGAVIHCEWYNSAVYDTDGRLVSVFSQVLDVTERQRAEQALRESEERFRAMADGLPLIVWVHGADGEQQFVNDTFCEFFDVTREQARTGQWQMLVHPDDTAYVTEFLACARERRPFHAQARVRHGTGQWRWIESWGRPRFSPSGEFLGLVGTSADITERKAAEDALTRHMEALEFVSASATDLLSEMASADLFNVIARQLQKVAGQAVVIVSEYDAAANQTIVRAIDGPNAKLERAAGLLGIDLIGLALPVAEGTLQRMTAGSLSHVEGGLFDLCFSHLPEHLCGQITRELDLGDIFAMPFVLNDDFMGTVAILTDKTQGLINRGIIETCVNQAGLALRRKRAEIALHRNVERGQMLALAISQLLQSADPTQLVQDLCRVIMQHLDCHVFSNYLLDPDSGRLHLNSFAGIPDEEATRIEWLDPGTALQNCVTAADKKVVAEGIVTNPDVRTELVARYGVKAYACHALTAPGGEVIGTLSFGTRSRETFADDELALIKAVTDHVAVAITRTRTEQALRQSESLLRTFIQQSRDGIVIIDSHGKVLEWSDGEEQITGIPRSEALGQLLWELQYRLAPEEQRTAEFLEKAQDKIIKGMRAGTSLKRTLEDEIQHADGTRRTLQTTVFPIAVGSDLLFGGISRDITEWKQAEVLSHAMTRIGAIVHSTLNPHEILQRVITEAAIAVASDTAAISLREGDGWTIRYVYDFPSETIGTWVSDEQEPHAVLAIRTIEPVVIDDTSTDERVNKDHLQRWGVRSALVVPLFIGNEASGVLIFNSHKQPFAFSKIHADFAGKLATSVSLALHNANLFDQAQAELIERTRAEAALLEHQRRLQTALASARMTVWHQDTNLRYTWIYNSELGFNPDMLYGKTDFDLLEPEQAEMLTALKQKVLDTGVGVRQDVFCSHAGKSMWFDLTVEPLRDISGAVIGLTCVSTVLPHERTRQKLLTEHGETLSEQ